MTAIEERIAEVLERHDIDDYCDEDGADVTTGIFCKCGWKGVTQRQANTHLADMLVAELGLTEEWMARHDSGGGRVFRDEAECRLFVETFVPRPPGVEDEGSGRFVGVEGRIVTRWMPA